MGAFILVDSLRFNTLDMDTFICIRMDTHTDTGTFFIYIQIYSHVNLFSYLNIREGGLIKKMVSVYESWGAKVG